MVKLQESKNRFSITIPKEYVKMKGWGKGQDLVLGFDQNGDIVVKELKD